MTESTPVEAGSKDGAVWVQPVRHRLGIACRNAHCSQLLCIAIHVALAFSPCMWLITDSASVDCVMCQAGVRDLTCIACSV